MPLEGTLSAGGADRRSVVYRRRRRLLLTLVWRFARPLRVVFRRRCDNRVGLRRQVAQAQLPVPATAAASHGRRGALLGDEVGGTVPLEGTLSAGGADRRSVVYRRRRRLLLWLVGRFARPLRVVFRRRGDNRVGLRRHGSRVFAAHHLARARRAGVDDDEWSQRECTCRR